MTAMSKNAQRRERRQLRAQARKALRFERLKTHMFLMEARNRSLYRELEAAKAKTLQVESRLREAQLRLRELDQTQCRGVAVGTAVLRPNYW